MTLGQEFKTYAVMIDEDIFRLRDAQALLKEVNLGATAIGTGDRKSTRLNSSHRCISYAVFCLKKKK